MENKLTEEKISKEKVFAENFRGVDKKRILWYNIDMRKAKIEEGKICPNCKKQENQIKIGYNRSGTQRCRCKECGTRYTLEPKKHEYPEEVKELAIKMYYSGVSGRGVGKALGMNKANVYNWIKKTDK